MVTTTELTATEAASILLLSRSGALRFEASCDPTGVSLESFEVPREGSIAGWVVTHGEPLVILDARADPRWLSQIDEATSFQTRSILAVPLQTRSGTIGVLEALNKAGDGPFNDEDVAILTTLAAQAAVAVENARLFQQSDLIAEMVHELRTPLAAIKATLRLILRPEIDEEQRRQLVETIAAETARLTRLTTEFLNLTRLESGRVRLKRRPVDLPALLSHAIATLHPQARARDITIALDIQPLDGFPQVTGDAAKLRQVALNLLTNAVKYNRRGGRVWVRLGVADDGQHALLEIEDNGRGIAPQAMEHLFERFYRVADDEGYSEGTGLGLAIARRIVEAHGGTIGVVSEVGKGTTFTLKLPLAS